MKIVTMGRNAALLKAQEQNFTDEGAPLAGVVGSDLPVFRRDTSGHVPASQARPDEAAKRELIAALQHRFRSAHQERDALATLAQEEQHLLACLRIDALKAAC